MHPGTATTMSEQNTKNHSQSNSQHNTYEHVASNFDGQGPQASISAHSRRPPGADRLALQPDYPNIPTLSLAVL